MLDDDGRYGCQPPGIGTHLSRREAGHGEPQGSRWISGQSGDDVIDDSKLEELRKFIPDHVLRTQISSYCELIPNYITKLIQSIDAADRAGILWHAHDLRGACGNIGASHLANIVVVIEDGAKNDRLDSLKDLISGLRLVENATLDTLRRKCGPL